MTPPAPTMLGHPDYPLPTVEEVIALNLRLGAPHQSRRSAAAA